MSRRKGEVKGREGAMLAQIPLVCSNSTEDVQHLKEFDPLCETLLLEIARTGNGLDGSSAH